jgi:hypothetical protein
MEHRSNGRLFDQWFYIATDANERKRLEAILIKAINPSQNKVHRANGRDTERRASRSSASQHILALSPSSQMLPGTPRTDGPNHIGMPCQTIQQPAGAELPI